MTEAPISTRGRQIVAVARQLLETEGAEADHAQTRRRIGHPRPVPVQAPAGQGIPGSRHRCRRLPRAATAFELAVDDARDPMAELVAAYRAFAAAHPHLYRLMTQASAPRTIAGRAGSPHRRAASSCHRQPGTRTSGVGVIHGMIILELNERFPSDGLTEPAWESGIQAFGNTPAQDPR